METLQVNIHEAKTQLSKFRGKEVTIARGNQPVVRLDVLTPYLLDELYRTPSNNTTRQWISDILTFFEHVPVEQIRPRLEAMIQEEKFSYRLRKRIEEILER